MIVIDTNVLLRILVTDEQGERQSQLAHRLVDLTVKRGDKVFIPTPVQVEVFWVLRQHFKLTKDNLCAVLNLLKRNSNYQLENPDIFAKALEIYYENNADFADYLILANTQQNQQPLWTFDKKLAKHPDVNLLNETNLTDFQTKIKTNQKRNI